ncbi:MAG TPA: hypothetical protein VEL76_04005 [Gemmataceae bacterium]|nr:hypothetical protein [Gemmataceae bacterium]
MFRIALTLLLVTPCALLFLVGLWFNSLLAAEAEELERRAGLVQKITINKAIGPGPLGDVWQALEAEVIKQCPQFHTAGRTKAAWPAFAERGVKDIFLATVYVPAQKDVELRKVLRDMLRPLKATYRLPGGVAPGMPGMKLAPMDLWIVPAGERQWREPRPGWEEI